MKRNYLLVAAFLLMAFQAGAQTLWNTNLKLARPTGTQFSQIQSISFSAKVAAIQPHAAIVGTDSALRQEKQAWFQADTFAHNNPQTASTFVSTLSKADPLVISKFIDLLSTDTVKKCISYILLALQDSADLQKYFAQLDSMHSTFQDSTMIRVLMGDIKAAVYKQAPPGKGRWTVFLNGDFLTTLQNSSSTSSSNSSVATGSIGANYTSPDQKQSVTLRITLVSTQDTITSNYGTEILVPSKGKGFGTMVFGYSHKIGNTLDTVHPWSVNGFITHCTEHWRLDSMPTGNATANAVDTFTQAASIMGLDFTFSKAWLCADSIPIGSAKFPLAFNVNFGLAERFLGGDVLKPLQTKNSALNLSGYYADAFPTKRTAFFGFESGASISLGPIMAEFETYYFFPNTSKDIRPLYGLTGLQFSFGASVNLNFFHN